MDDAKSIPANHPALPNTSSDAEASSLLGQRRPEQLLWPIAIALMGLSTIIGFRAHIRSFHVRDAARHKQALIEQVLSTGQEPLAVDEPVAYNQTVARLENADGIDDGISSR